MQLKVFDPNDVFKENGEILVYLIQYLSTILVFSMTQHVSASASISTNEIQNYIAILNKENAILNEQSKEIASTTSKTDSLKYVRIGNGTVAPLHRDKLNRINVQQIGIIDTDEEKWLNQRVFTDYTDAAAQKPDFWDVCVPPESHLSVVKTIIEVDPFANILLETPVCLVSEIEEFNEVLKNFKGKITVNENYLASNVTKIVKQIAFDLLKLNPTKISIEMTKDRTPDFARGRYFEPAGALTYEGRHMLTTILALGKEYLSGSISQDPAFTDAFIPDINNSDVIKIMNRQGSGDVTYITENNVEVNFYSSMIGDIRNQIPSQDNVSEEIPFDSKIEKPSLRHRVLVIEGKNALNEDVKVVGFFEPLNNCERSIGKVRVYLQNKELGNVFPIHDDTMGTQLKHAVEFFKGERNNPSPLKNAFDLVKILDKFNWSPKGTKVP